MCCQQRETVCHILWDCPLARNVWALVRGKIQKSNAHASDFFPLTRSMLESLPIEEMELWAVLSWAIWNARNKICFEDDQAQPDHYKNDCYLRRNLFDDYKMLLEKLAFSMASLFHRQLLVKY